MLSKQEQEDVFLELADALGEAGNFQNFVRTTFVSDYKAILTSQPTNLNGPKDAASYLLTYCMDSEWSLRPSSLMEQLLSRLILDGRIKFIPVRERIRQGVHPPDDVFTRKWISGDLPFFDREGLRGHLRPLFFNGNQPILRINGPVGCGKSYSREFCDHLAQEARRDAFVVSVSLERGMGPSFPAEELADALVAPTRVSIKERPPRSTSYYPRALARWVLNSAMQTPGTWIYVLDGFDQQDVVLETSELIRLLAQEVIAGEYRRHFRMILIDFKAAVGNVLPTKILNDNVPDPALINEIHIADCLEQHYTERKPADGLALDKNELLSAAKTLLEGAPPAGRERLEHLSAKLYQLRQSAPPSSSPRGGG